VVPVQFTGVAQTVAEPNWTPVSLPVTIDGNTGNQLAGYNSPSGSTPSTTLRVAYSHSTPQNRVRGLRLWNQGGNDLTDSDGLGAFVAEYYAGAALVFTQNCQGFNGGQAFDQWLPNDGVLDGITGVVLRNLGKLSGSTIAPLWRELQLLELRTVYPCRRRNGTLEWYDEAGNLIPVADLRPCEPLVPAPTSVRLAGQFFGDDPGGTGENLCNVSPAPSPTSGWNVIGACYDPVTVGPTMDWTNVTAAEMEYSQQPGGVSGGVNVIFRIGATDFQWPAQNQQMSPGDSVWSTNYVTGRRARLTYVSGPAAGSPSGTIRPAGGAAINVHFGNVSAVSPIRFRIEFFQA
jgi:hypothetical protein